MVISSFSASLLALPNGHAVQLRQPAADRSAEGTEFDARTLPNVGTARWLVSAATALMTPFV